MYLHQFQSALKRSTTNGIMLVAAASACAADSYTGPPPKFDPRPRVAISADELKELKASPEFAAKRDSAINAAQPLITSPISVPDGYGGWVFDYACRDDGTSLHAISPKEHECPKCKKRYTGEREVIAYRCLQHHELERAITKLAWAYTLSGDDPFAKETKRILLKLADDYHTYPARRDRWGRTGWLAMLGGRRYVQSLDESVGVIELAKAYDATRDSSVWTDAERAHVEKDFFRATAESLLKFTQPHNHQTWYNAGLVAIASALADEELLLRVINMNRGVLDQLANNVGSDGLWNEGTMAYHNYALQPLVQTADMTRRLGMNLYEHPKLKLMITGPLHAAYPNGQFPAINDSDRGDVRMFDWAFAWAKKTYGAALDTSLPKTSEALEDAGLAILRAGEGTNAACAFLDYGPHGGGHGHYDKLNLMLYANGREWLLDPGRITYSHKEYKTWVKETAAHNTVTLGGASQTATTGRLLWLKQGDGWAACAAESDGAYQGVTLRRFLFLTPDFLVDVFDVKAERNVQMDWFAHAVSDKLTNSLGIRGKPKSPGNANGYQHLKDGIAYSVRESSRWEFVADKTRLCVWLDTSHPEEIFTTVGIGYTVDQKVPCLIRRRHARQARFVAVYDLRGSGDQIRAVRTERDPLREPKVEVETAAGSYAIRLSPKEPRVERPCAFDCFRLDHLGLKSDCAGNEDRIDRSAAGRKEDVVLATDRRDL
jgi:hypothetical protein